MNVCFLAFRHVWFVGKLLLLAPVAGVLVPALFGAVFQGLVAWPLRAHLTQILAPCYFQDWLVGLVLVKLWVRLMMAGVFGNSLWKVKLERTYANGWENLDLNFLFLELLGPLLVQLLLILTLPIVLAHVMMPLCALLGDKLAASHPNPVHLALSITNGFRNLPALPDVSTLLGLEVDPTELQKHYITEVNQVDVCKLCIIISLFVCLLLSLFM